MLADPEFSALVAFKVVTRLAAVGAFYKATRKPKPRKVNMDLRPDVEKFIKPWAKKVQGLCKEAFDEVRGNLKRGKRHYRIVGKKSDVGSFMFDKTTWRETFSKANKDLTKMVVPLASDLVAERLGLGTAFEMNQVRTLRWMADNAKRFGWSITDTLYDNIKEELMAGIDAGESIAELADRLAGKDWLIGDERAELIARTETLKGTNWSSKETMRQSGVVTGVEWLTTDDDMTCPECAAMNGVRVDVDENFFDAGEDPQTIGDSDLEMILDYEDIEAPPLHPDCRCTLLAVLGDAGTGVTDEPAGDEE